MNKTAYNKGGASPSSRGGMPWILAQTVIFQLNTLECSLSARIGHISLIYSEVRAIVDAKQDLNIEKEDYQKLQETKINIDVLRDSYEPFLDDPESSNSGAGKRKNIEKLIDVSRYSLMYIIEKYKLVDVKTLQDIQGLTWGE